MNESLQKRPRFRDMTYLSCWYRCHIKLVGIYRKKAKREEPPGYFSMEYACFLAACFNDRKYIDDVFKYGFDIRMIKERRLVQICRDIGWTLCDLGYYEDGIKYLEKSVELCPDDNKNAEIKNAKIFSTWVLCFRLNNKADRGKKLEFIKALENKVGKLDVGKEEDMFIILVKTYIDKKMFNEALELLKGLTKEDLKDYGFLWAELYFAQGNFKVSADTFEKYTFPKPFHFWRVQYDYKKALAYYYSDQIEKCRKQAIKIRRRKKWDRFYRLEELGDIGVKREKFIDEIIGSDLSDKFYIDMEKIDHCVRASAYIIWCYLLRWQYPIMVIIAIIIFLLLFYWFNAKKPVIRIPRSIV